MGYRVAVIHQGFVPIYRRGFFERLNACSDTTYVVVHGRAPSGTGHVALPEPYAFPNLRVRNRELRLRGRRVIYQPILRRVLFGGFDAIVIGHEIKFPASMLLFALFKLLRKPVILWGHGYHRSSASGIARRTSAALALAADGYLAYTEMSVERLRAAGVAADKITVVRNTIDMAEQEAAYDACQQRDVPALQAELGLDAAAQTLVFVGRLEDRKRVDELIAAVKSLALDGRGEPVELVVIGDGPSRAALQAQAEGTTAIRFTGPIYDAAEIAKYLRCAVAVVVPDAVGLVVNHAFAHGRPIVTRQSTLHGPEAEYLRDGVNALIVAPGRPLADALRDFLADRALQQRLAHGAIETRAAMSLEAAAEAFDRGVRAALARR
jgi:glycosyltransferase involved in cell wall biosynthesis